MDWSKVINLGNKAKDIVAMAKDSLSAEQMSQDKGQEKSLFGKKEQAEADALALQLDEQKKKQETTLMYVIGGLLLLVFTGIIKIGK